MAEHGEGCRIGPARDCDRRPLDVGDVRRNKVERGKRGNKPAAELFRLRFELARDVPGVAEELERSGFAALALPDGRLGNIARGVRSIPVDGLALIAIVSSHRVST